MARAIDKETMLDLIIKAKRTDPGIRSFAEWLAEYLVEHLPTLTLPNEWISVEERLPRLPNTNYCSVMVLTAYNGDSKSRPMIYERSLVRGRRVERWKYYWDRIADETPDYWMPLPHPPSYLFPEEKKNAPHDLISRSALLRGETEPEITTGSDSELAEHMEWDRWMDKIKRAPAVDKEGLQ